MLKRKFYIYELILAAHVGFCILIEVQSYFHPIERKVDEYVNPKANPHANHNQYFDLYGFFGFFLLLGLKWLIEGTRSNTLLIMLAYLFFFLDRVFQYTDKVFCQVSAIATIIYVWTCIAFPVYELPLPTGKHKVSYKTIRLHDPYQTFCSVYYPCNDHNLKEQSVQWLPKKLYTDQLYQFIICRGWTPLPQWCFSLAFRFLEKIQFPCLLNVPVLGDKHPVIIYSHGLTQHQNAYSAQCLQWASEGYVVFCPQHQEMVYPWDVKDTKIAYKGTYPEIIEKFQKVRSAHLEWRYEQVIHLLQFLKSGKTKELFYEFQPTEINLIGHSFGGATVIKVGQNIKVNSIIAHDPWLFPFKEEDLKKKVQNRCLILSKEKDIKYDEVFQERTLKEFLQNNEKIQHYKVKGMDHVHTNDTTYFLGADMVLFGQLRTSETVHHINQLMIQLTTQFMKNISFNSDQMKQLI